MPILRSSILVFVSNYPTKNLKFAKKMIKFSYCALLVFALVGCDGSKSSKTSTLPENVKDDRPIVIKEGQAIVLTPEGKASILIGASVVDGKLSISEIDAKGKSFSVTWDDENSWTTSTVDSAGDQTTTIIDKNGDGIPDIRAIMKDGSLSRSQLEDPKWSELK